MNHKPFRFFTSSVAAITLAAAPFAHAADKNKAYTDPAKADEDYALQGEYTGSLGGKKTGAHVIALGGGKFDVVLYPGGLPGDGWDGDRKNRKKGKIEGGKKEVTIDGNTLSLKDGKLGDLKRFERKSPTLGAKPPAGAVILFDGTNADGFKGGKMESGLLQQGSTSKEIFGSHKVHLEFRLPYKPYARGQGRGNSGFYAQGRYEVQMLDSFGLEGHNNEGGGIYGVKPPDVNMCYPPLQWQTYDVDFTAAEFKDGKKVKNARMTVRHNGVVIHDNVEVPKSTTASPLREGPEDGPVYLQNHGNPVVYRNIWVVRK